MYISGWEIHTRGLRQIITTAFWEGKIATDDIVWRGPSGDAYIGTMTASIEEEHSEYVDSGLVNEYLEEATS